MFIYLSIYLSLYSLIYLCASLSPSYLPPRSLLPSLFSHLSYLLHSLPISSPCFLLPLLSPIYSYLAHLISSFSSFFSFRSSSRLSPIFSFYSHILVHQLPSIHILAHLLCSHISSLPFNPLFSLPLSFRLSYIFPHLFSLIFSLLFYPILYLLSHLLSYLLHFSYPLIFRFVTILICSNLAPSLHLLSILESYTHPAALSPEP